MSSTAKTIRVWAPGLNPIFEMTTLPKKLELVASRVARNVYWRAIEGWSDRDETRIIAAQEGCQSG
ncbi:MAG: hypothetical protein ACRDG6_12830 [Candidatus Limnocylindria bacterium]